MKEFKRSRTTVVFNFSGFFIAFMILFLEFNSKHVSCLKNYHILIFRKIFLKHDKNLIDSSVIMMKNYFI